MKKVITLNVHCEVIGYEDNEELTLLISSLKEMILGLGIYGVGSINPIKVTLARNLKTKTN